MLGAFSVSGSTPARLLQGPSLEMGHSEFIYEHSPSRYRHFNILFRNDVEEVCLLQKIGDGNLIATHMETQNSGGQLHCRTCLQASEGPDHSRNVGTKRNTRMLSTCSNTILEAQEPTTTAPRSLYPGTSHRHNTGGKNTQQFLYLFNPQFPSRRLTNTCLLRAPSK